MRGRLHGTGRIARWRLSALAVAMGVLMAYGGPSIASTSSGGDASPEAEATDVTAAATAPLVGRWMQVHTCDQLVAGLEGAGLGAIAPSVIGDYFPDATAEELAAKEDPCSGARPQRHFHFFDAAGLFGSLDQFEQQVDDGTYTMEGDTLLINDGAWTFTISGNQLSLEPVISDAQVEEALADPLQWSTAGWIVAVAYPGTTWKRVACKGWC
jgi:hypothetical protein